MTDKKVKHNGDFMTEEEYNQFIADCKEHVESNHPIEYEGDFMDMLIEGAAIYREALNKRNKRKNSK